MALIVLSRHRVGAHAAVSVELAWEACRVLGAFEKLGFHRWQQT